MFYRCSDVHTQIKCMTIFCSAVVSVSAEQAGDLGSTPLLGDFLGSLRNLAGNCNGENPTLKLMAHNLNT